MKRNILYYSFLLTMLLTGFTGMAQNTLVQDQNPRYQESRDKYMSMSDSINTWHSTTYQDTYKAIDFLVDRREARAERRNFRREIRLARAQNYRYYDDYNDYYYPQYRNYNNNYYRPYGYRSGYRNNYNLRNTLPLALTIGTLGWLWCR
jgi:hypothetical protein